MPSSFPFDPMWMLRLPLGGDVWQKIFTTWFSPSFTLNYNGDPDIERRVVTEVAGYGRQLGWLTDIVLALAAGQAPPPATLAKIRQAADQIERIKRESQGSARTQAEAALDKLALSAPEEFRKLVTERYASLTRGSGTA